MTTPARLTFAAALAPIALGDVDAPTWVQILAAGAWKHPKYGDLRITPDDLAEFQRNFDARARAFVYGDYDHGTRSPTGDGNAISSGEVKALEVRADGRELWALFEPTAPARQKIADREYRYTSADFETHYVDKRTGKAWGKVLHGFALTNRPFIEGMAPLALCERRADDAARDASAPVLCAEYDAPPPPTPEAAPAAETSMSVKTKLQLADTASEQDVETAVDTLLAERQAAETNATLLTDVRTVLGVAEGDDLVTAARTLAEHNGTLTKEKREREADALVDGAVRVGKIAPAEKPAWRTQLLSEVPAVVDSAKALLNGMTAGRIPVGVQRAAANGGEPTTGDRADRLDQRATTLLSEDPALKAQAVTDPSGAYKVALARAAVEIPVA